MKQNENYQNKSICGDKTSLFYRIVAKNYFEQCFLGKNHKNQPHFCLVTHSFTKLSQNVHLINTHILIY